MKALRYLILTAFAALIVAGGLAFAQVSPCGPDQVNCQAAGGSRWIVGAARGVTGTLEFLSGSRLKFGSTTFIPVRGETALDGSNPTSVVTGLTAIDGCSLTRKSSVAPGVSTGEFSYTTSGGTLNLYGWKPTNSGDTTQIASTSTDTVGWLCFGN